MKRSLSITAVVPTLDEEDRIACCLEGLRAAGVNEIIVVDGGSEDETVDRARPLADRIDVVSRGLFAQMNRGAELAVGDVLLFHFADATLDREAVEKMRDTLEDSRIEGGAFRLRFDSRAWFFRVVATFAHWRNRLGLGPFGDQSIFVRADVFRCLDGFRTGRVFADHELARALRRRRAFRLLAAPVTTSPRRWKSRGRGRTLLAHWRMSVAYLLGLRGDTRRSQPVREKVEALRRVR
jgi:rSAM/selenodomain-associated transferase 2